MLLLMLCVLIVLSVLFFNSSKRYLNHAVLPISLPVVLVDAIDYVVKPLLPESLHNQMINSLEIHIHFSKQVLMSYQGVMMMIMFIMITMIYDNLLSMMWIIN